MEKGSQMEDALPWCLVCAEPGHYTRFCPIQSEVVLPPAKRRRGAAGPGAIGRLGTTGKALGICFPSRNCSRRITVGTFSASCPVCPLTSLHWTQEDILSIGDSEEAGEQELAFPSEHVESDSTSPAVKLSLSAELLPLIKRATTILQVPWPTECETRQSIDDVPTISPIQAPPPQCTQIFFLKSRIPGITRQQLLLFPGRWTPRVHDAEKLGLAQFPPAKVSIAALAQVPNLELLSKDATFPNKQCWARAICRGPFLRTTGPHHNIWMSCAWLTRTCSVCPNSMGRNLAALVAARRQRGLSQAHVPDGDKAPLLEAPIAPGHAFGPAVDEMLQRSKSTNRIHYGAGWPASQGTTSSA
ncbi:UNVERIFIED_CONTAM: hypothetical protein FKN15_040746 [Acipenser sinensis]